jgi:hypothetical protein
MRLRSGKTTTTNSDIIISECKKEHSAQMHSHVFWIDNMLTEYKNLLTDVHNENLEKSNDVYWEDISRVLIETYSILNEHFDTLYDFDKNHRDYLLDLEPHACRSLQMLYHVMTSENVSNQTQHVLDLCLDEMGVFIKKVRKCKC